MKLKVASIGVSVLLGGCLGSPTPPLTPSVVARPPAPASIPRLASLNLSSNPALGGCALELARVVGQIDPAVLSQAGLLEDLEIPSFAPARVEELNRALARQLQAMRALPWRDWSVDEQIDLRWLYANAQLALRILSVEKPFRSNPATWLEPLQLILGDLATWAPARDDLAAAIFEQIPPAMSELELVCTSPSRDDVHFAQRRIQGLLQAVRNFPANSHSARLQAAVGPACQSLEDCSRRLEMRTGPEHALALGAQNYDWRLRHALLLPWSGEQLLAMARGEKVTSSATSPSTPTGLAENLTREHYLQLYADLAARHLETIRTSGLVTLPTGLVPLRVRETPDALVAVQGDGESMNPAPAFGSAGGGWWNVPHFDPRWPLEKRRSVVGLLLSREPVVAAHEGIPGHQLQAGVTRRSTGLRKLFPDGVAAEGWAVYSEQLLWDAGGLGQGRAAHSQVLASYELRVRRATVDIRVERGDWSLAQGAAYLGVATDDGEIRRTCDDPTQLVSYFAGYQQLVQLRRDCRSKWDAAYSDRRFHDELLQTGGIPLRLARCKLLGEPVPPLD